MQDSFTVVAKSQVLIGNTIRNILNISLEGGQLNLPVNDELYRKVGPGDTVQFHIVVVQKYDENRVVPN